MTKYLSMNGTSDYITISNLIYTRFVIDFEPNFQTSSDQYYLDNTTYKYPAWIVRHATGIDQYASNWFGGYVNGSGTKSANNSTWFTTNNTRYTFDITGSALLSGNTVYIFSSNTGTNFLAGKIHDIKFYNGSTLVCHLDMSTGTVNDQSGNGNNATLHGGTWLDSGGATGTPVTYTYDTKQSIYANIQSNYDTKQSIYANRVTQFDTKQTIYKPINQSYDTKQAIYKAIQELFDTEQVFTQAYTQVSYTYDMKIQQYKDIQESVDTKQAYYTDISVDLDTKQVIYKQIQSLYDTLIQIRNTHDETLYGTLTIQRVIEHRLTINKRHSEDLKIERVLNHILRV